MFAVQTTVYTIHNDKRMDLVLGGLLRTNPRHDWETLSKVNFLVILCSQYTEEHCAHEPETWLVEPLQGKLYSLAKVGYV